MRAYIRADKKYYLDELAEQVGAPVDTIAHFKNIKSDVVSKRDAEQMQILADLMKIKAPDLYQSLKGKTIVLDL